MQPCRSGSQSGWLEQWIARLKQPAVRARVAAEMREPHPQGWESYYAGAGPEKTLLLAFKNPALKPLTGKTLADVARMRGESPEETAMDLVAEDGSRVAVAYFLMSENNVRRQIALPWMSFAFDESALVPEGVFLLSHVHPRAYGNFARLLGHYVRETQVLSLAEATRRLTSLPAGNLSLKDRGHLAPGLFADIVVFDPATISDHATYDNPAQLATGVAQVLVNGRFAVRDGLPTGAATGRWCEAGLGQALKAAAVKHQPQTGVGRDNQLPAPWLANETPVAFKKVFSGDAAKQRQWHGFLRRTAIAVAPQPLPELLEKVATFIVPPAKAAADRIAFVSNCHPGVRWTEGTTQSRLERSVHLDNTRT